MVLAYTHLQITTSYSLLSSTIAIPQLVAKAAEMRLQALAITDRNVLYGAVPFYKECVRNGIKPIIGMTADITEPDGLRHSLILLAADNTGYNNLIKISSAIQTGESQALPAKWLAGYSRGLIAISPGSSGKIEQQLMAGNRDGALGTAQKFAGMFGPDGFYLSVHEDGSGEKVLSAQISDLSAETSIPVAALHEVLYLESEDAFAQQCLLAIRDGIKLEDMETGAVRTGDHYLKPAEEMERLFESWPDAVQNTAKIAECCNTMIETGQRLLPKYPLPEGETAPSLLKKLCEKGLKLRSPEGGSAYRDRLHYELEIIENMGFSDYFLIVWDFMKFAREQGIMTGPGRGSAAGSLAAYALYITDVDPIEYGLLFERFLNPERVSMPDIDIDFPDHRRDEVIDYVREKYGRLHVAQIITFGTLAAKAALRDLARIFGFQAKEMEQLSRLLPSHHGMTLESAYRESSAFRKFAEENERNRLLYETALKIEGLPRHSSTHAAGVVISERPLVDLIPIQGSHSETYLTQYPMEVLEEIGLLKMDFLGLRNLTILERITKSISRQTGMSVDIKAIPLDDKKTFALLQTANTTGVFQLESQGMRKVLRDIKPSTFEDIVAVNALYRPGPMENIPVYAARKHGREKADYMHPDIRPILEVTYGVIVYQEQIMQIASKMAGFSLGEADILRRAVSKKKKEVLDRERKHFVAGAATKGYSTQTAEETYDLIVRFANYGFNRSHAVAYGMIAYQLAYLKAHYPMHFMAALLSSVIGNDDKIASYISEAKQMGLEILPPSINRSHYPFKAEKEGIRFSLAGVRGIGNAVLREIIRARQSGPFTDLFDFCLRVSGKIITRKILESLVCSGSLDEFGKDRAVLLASIDIAIEHAELMRPANDGHDLFAGELPFQIKPKYADVEPIGSVDKLVLEKQALGVYLSDHPASLHARAFRWAGAQPLIQLSVGRRRTAGIYIANVKTIRTKKGEVMAFISASDSSGELEGVLFPEVYRKYSELCKTGEVLLAKGNVEERNGKRQFIIQEMKRPEELAVPADDSVLFVKIPADLHSPEKLHEVDLIMRKYHGETNVVLHYERNEKTIRLPQKSRVDPHESCLQELRKALGEQNVILK